MRLVVIRLIFSFFISFILTFYLVPLFCSIAKKLNILDIPDGTIKKHKNPTPYLGGMALYIGFIASLALVFPFENKVLLVLLGSTLLLFTGLIDDILRIKPYQKFFWQMIAAFCFLKSGFYLKESFFLSNIWNIPISMLWILTIINAFNLIDVMDGLATLTAGCVTATFIILALLLGQSTLALLLMCFLGPLCAFFWYNRPPAKIYLGDAGSLFIGGFLATIPFLFDWGRYNRYGFLAPIIVLAIPIFEVLSLILIRSYKKIPFYYGSPDHFSIYLQQKGWSAYKILGFVLGFSVFLLALAFVVVFTRINLAYLIITGLILLLFWIYSIWHKS
jgi:UDP-GlcNAc:undecaprenyl-phosphate/decaprenyl-phosphate GlcNAc-1-phosphate transferase